MKNKKVLIAIMTIITILLICSTIGIILNKTNIGIFKIANNTTMENQEIQISEIKEVQFDVNQAQNIKISTNIEEERMATTSSNKMLQTVASRSEVERLNINPLYVPMKENGTQNDYEELKTYIKLSDVQISFNMDVSKPTGLSKEDFVQLVTNMKYDKTGILKKNAACIWECCQKYNVNEIFVLGICGIESGWCSAVQHQKAHNYSSLMKSGKLISYLTDEQGFEAMIKLLGEKYLSKKGSFYHGATIKGVGTCYCNTTTWPNKVYKCMTQVLQ